MSNAALSIRDHQVVRCADGLFTPARALKEHMVSREWLEGELAIPYDGKTVVITHHGPHPLSVHPRYADDPINAAFVSGLGDLLGHADLWLHGHVHDSFDYTVDECRVVANPRGYARNRTQVNKTSALHFENPAFQWACVIDL